MAVLEGTKIKCGRAEVPIELITPADEVASAIIGKLDKTRVLSNERKPSGQCVVLITDDTSVTVTPDQLVIVGKDSKVKRADEVKVGDSIKTYRDRFFYLSWVYVVLTKTDQSPLLKMYQLSTERNFIANRVVLL